MAQEASDNVSQSSATTAETDTLNPSMLSEPGDLASRVQFTECPSGKLQGFTHNWEEVRSLRNASFGSIVVYRHREAGEVAKQEAEADLIVVKKMPNTSCAGPKSTARDSHALNKLCSREGENPLVEIGAYDYLKEMNMDRQCPYILEMHSYWQCSKFIHLAVAYCSGGNLFEKASEKGGLGPMVAVYTRQLLTAVSFLHSHNIAHRDISLENILIVDASCDSIRLMDFGVACPINNGEKPIMYSATNVGKLPYRPPEMYSNQGLPPSYRADKVDAFACGMAMYYMYTGVTLWKNARPTGDLDTIYKYIRDYGFESILDHASYETCSKRIDRDAIQIISKLLDFDVSKRFSINGALSSCNDILIQRGHNL